MLLVASASARAAVPHGSSARVAADTLTAMPGAKLTKPLRIVAGLRWGQATPPFAWSRLAATGTWQAAWDQATGVPRRIWGSGIAAPGAMASAAVAEQVARQMLADHLGLLAPGAAIGDFQLVSNTSDGDIRSVGFVQLAGGHRVVGGQVSFRFKHDRLFVIGSEALPNVAFAVPKAKLAASALRARATTGLRAALALPNAPVTATGADLVLPLVTDDAVLGYRLVTPFTIDGGVDGRYAAYVDPASGDVVAVQQLNEYATGTVLYHGVDRYPDRGRIDYQARRAHEIVNDVPTTTSETGGLDWSPDSQAQLQTSIDGDLVTIVNKAAGGLAAIGAYTIDPGGQAVWDASGLVEDDAQVISYIDVNIVKDYVRNHVDATMPTLDEQIVVNVNIDQACNAFFDGKALNFFHRTDTCENTGRLQDVHFHEYGHRVHTAEIIEGVGNFDGAMSEGAADFLAVSITGDPGMGRGFFIDAMTGKETDKSLRNLDPIGSEWTWPTDVGEIHATGMIFGGTFWDLRKRLIGDLGDTAGIALVNKLYVGALRRAVDIPSSLIEVLATDDDDGNLANGTPHECAIRDIFSRHGMRTATGTVTAPGHLDENALSIGVVVEVTGLSANCTGDELTGATLTWTPPSTGIPASGSVAAIDVGANRFYAQLPLSPQNSVSFEMLATFTAGTALTLADNYADPFYQLYTGHTKTLYCTDFEDGDPFAAGWTSGTNVDMPSLWAWGTPTSGTTDPHAAYSGTHILALGLNGEYRPKEQTWVQMPEIDVGQYSDVRVQYRRWLAVEDSHYDQARVTANGTKAWQNSTQNIGDSSSRHHIDREWRFHDVSVSPYFFGHKLTVGWDLTSDEGLELGGWAIDDVCVVANPFSICGDGAKSATEDCDNGPDNVDAPDKCRTDCRLPACGDGITDLTEECDAGLAGSPTCSPQCKLIDIPSAGCCSTTGGGAGSLVLGGLVALLWWRPRRRATGR